MIPWQTSFGNNVTAFSKENPLPEGNTPLFQQYISNKIGESVKNKMGGVGVPLEEWQNRGGASGNFLSDIAARFSGNPTTGQVQEINATSVQPTAWRPAGTEKMLPVAKRPTMSQGFINPSDQMFRQNTEGGSGGGF